LKLVVIIPTYNEAENLQKMVSALFNLNIPNLGILIVDDHSPDGTGELAEQIKEKDPRVDVLHRTGKLGLGSAYIQGFKKAIAEGAELIGQMDCDFSHPPEKLAEMAQAALEGFDLVIGSRYIPGGKLDTAWPYWRKALSGFGNYYARTILGMKVRDVTAGFRIWQRKMLEKMPLDKIKSNGYVFQVEMAYVAQKLRCRVREIPIYFADRKLGKSKMSFRIQVEAAIRVWKLLIIHKNL
jgi:dolichol-phosphate mannosyltransferase